MLVLPTMAYVKGRNGIDMGMLVCEAMRECDMQHKEAWVLQGYPDGSQWSKALRGMAPLDLWYMRHLPNRFWQVFLPKLASALIRRMWSNIVGDLKMVKAVETHSENERKSA